MKRFGLILGCCMIVQFSIGQDIDMKELTSLLDLNQAKLESHLQKRGFRRNFYEDHGDIGVCYTRQEKITAKGEDRGKIKNTRTFRIIGREGGYELAYQTTCENEDLMLKKEMHEMGFSCAPKAGDQSILFQKQDISIESFTKKMDSSLIYVLKANKKELPRKRDIVGAEDLLQLDANEYLTEVFGKENVKTDVFYFTENETNKCSVLYPNTDREAIFIWNDESNMRDLSFIVIGGTLKPKQNTGSVNQVAHNSWTSKQGIYCGMSLKEVELLNQGPIRFYNWNTESAGYLAPNNKGAIDFNRLGIMFNCLNCNFLKVENTRIQDSENALEENQKVYVTTLIILPDKKNSDARVHR
ncbi:MAG: hypothetical protein ACJ749_16935 [Flavisolibacter sp.]